MLVAVSLLLVMSLFVSLSLWGRLTGAKKDTTFWYVMYKDASAHHDKQFKEWTDILNSLKLK